MPTDVIGQTPRFEIYELVFGMLENPMAVLIGSRALQHWFGAHTPRDWDLVVTPAELDKWLANNTGIIDHVTAKHSKKVICLLINGRQVEFDIAYPGDSSSLLLSTVTGDPINIPGGEAYVAPPEALYWTKRSHAYWPVHWHKTMHHLSYLKSRVQLTKTGRAYYEMRYKENVAKFGEPKRAYLDQSNEDFFGKSAKIGRVFEHDFIHECISYPAVPMHVRFREDPNRALMSERLFREAKINEQIQCVNEEAMVIGIERKLVPGLTDDPAIAYSYGLMRLSTTLSSGWFREFCIDNHSLVANTMSYAYWLKFQQHSGWEP